MLLHVCASLLLVASGANPEGPCDIYASAQTPCVAAHSMVRAMYKDYAGPLYTLKRNYDNTTLDILPKGDGSGFADSAAQVAFCTTPKVSVCIVERIYDQSLKGNHLERIKVFGNDTHGWPTSGINAMRDELSVGGHAVFSAYFEGGQTNWPGTGTHSGTQGFRSNRIQGNASGVAVADEPETVYMVTSGTHYNNGCCFDYGNTEVSGCGAPNTRRPCDDAYYASSAAAKVAANPKCPGCGEMEAISWSTMRNGPERNRTSKSANHPGAGVGPWIMGDLESGVWAGNDPVLNPSNVPLNTSLFVSAFLKGNSGNHWSIKAGDAQVGSLKTLYDGPRPPGYEVMKKQGAIILGVGGDDSSFGIGTFYEGAMTHNYTSDATDDAVQRNIVALGYGQQ